MAGVINSSSFAKALFPGVSSWWGKAYNEFSTEYTDLFNTMNSSRSYEEHVGVTSFGLAQVKPEGQAISYDDESQAYVARYSHTVYALGFIITREMYEDDLYDIVGQRRASSLAFSMRQTKEVVAANVYNRAFNSSYPGADSVELISTAHPNFAGGTQSNELATPADISEAALEQACIDIQKWTNDRGLRIAVLPSTIHIAPEEEFEVARILNSVLRSGVDTNDINALRMMGKFPGGVKVNHYFTDADAWFIRTNAKDGLIHYNRRGAEFTIDNDFDTENAKYKATERYSFGWTDWRGIYGSAGA